MNTQPCSPLRVSPLHLQQGMFATLAVLVTLIAAQLFHQWELRQDAEKLNQFVRHSVVHATPLGVSAVGVSEQRAEQTSPGSENPRPVRWVF